MAQPPGGTQQTQSRLASQRRSQARPEKSRRKEIPRGNQKHKAENQGEGPRPDQDHEVRPHRYPGGRRGKKNEEIAPEVRLAKPPASNATRQSTVNVAGKSRVSRAAAAPFVPSASSAHSAAKGLPGRSLRPFSASCAAKDFPGARRTPMPTAIHPMLATSIDAPFDSPDWLFEIKWDGYRAIAFLEKNLIRLVSRNQNDLTAQYPDLHDLPNFLNAKTAILDGEIVALDEHGRSSFSLMQQRTGFRERGRRAAAKPEVRVLYYAFDLLYFDGYDLRRVPLEHRKQALASLLNSSNDTIRLSDHFVANGKALFNVARQKGLEGILAKQRASLYEERRTREWLKIKITRRLEAVIGGYTEPEGSREHFGSVVLGLYDKQGKLEALKKVHWVRPKLVAEIEFSEWTHLTEEGGSKLRAPVFLGLRDDKDPKECVLEQ